MRRPLALIAAVVLVTATAPAPAAAQQYRARVDASAQAVSFRGLVSDSIAFASVVPAPSGGLETPDGHAVRCGAGDFCYFLRPGEALRGIPVTTTAHVVLWGFGVQGLTLRATGRLLADLGRDRVWPGTDPSAQLIEGYLEYQRSGVVARGGRQVVMSRLEPIGFDGGWLKVRWADAALELAGYGGWGLGQAAARHIQVSLEKCPHWRIFARQRSK